ncbi:MAG: glycosyltransferase N-terminal domain-containing protein [Microscillaceae bacterium]|nr:glycosyltransferase N-terminal domain-containing protein [Microscillaceae bacterium]
MKIVYWLVISLYFLLLRGVAFFNPKARKWVEGRKGVFERVEAALKGNQSPILWFHAASLGEFEQGRPVMEQLKALYPEIKIFLTFFSPSGYEVRKNYEKADYIFYLPADSPRNAPKLIALIKPKAVFFIKYEFWYFYLREVQKAGIPLILFSATFRESQFFFKSYSGMFRKLLRGYSHIFVQNQRSLDLLKNIGIHQSSVAYDTRFDRVLAGSLEAREIPLAEKFKNKQKLLVIGSCWGRDLDVLLPFLNEFTKPLKVIIAPHEIKESTLERIENALKNSTIRYSQAQLDTVRQYEVLLIDNVGMLSALYRYGEFAYIGGAFGEGLHNILEPAVYGVPIFFGSDYKDYPEAEELIQRRGAYSIRQVEELSRIFQELYENEELRRTQGENSKKYILEHGGGTQEIVRYFQTLV